MTKESVPAAAGEGVCHGPFVQEGVSGVPARVARGGLRPDGAGPQGGGVPRGGDGGGGEPGADREAAPGGAATAPGGRRGGRAHRGGGGGEDGGGPQGAGRGADEGLGGAVEARRYHHRWRQGSGGGGVQVPAGRRPALQGRQVHAAARRRPEDQRARPLRHQAHLLRGGERGGEAQRERAERMGHRGYAQPVPAGLGPRQEPHHRLEDGHDPPGLHLVQGRRDLSLPYEHRLRGLPHHPLSPPRACPCPAR